MNKIYITCESSNFASRLIRDLRRMGIKSELIHNKEAEKGCSYSVSVNEKFYNIIDKHRQKYRITNISGGSDG